MKRLKLNFGINSYVNKEPHRTKDSLEQILGDTLLRNDNLYIIGSEAILDINAPGTQGTGDSVIFLFNAIADYINEPSEGRPEDERGWHLWFKRKNLQRTICQSAWKSKVDEIDLTDYVSKELIEFLENGIKYRLVNALFTTCIDPILEVIVRQLCNEYGLTFNVYNYKIDIQKPNTGGFSLVYLWGKIGDEEESLDRKPIDYVFTEDDAMVTIADYIKKANDNNKDLVRDIFYEKRIMAIGCRFYDWKFRFFWYSIRGDLDKLSMGTVSYSCSKPDNDPLYLYLKNTRGLHVEDDSRRFMHQLASTMETEDLFSKIKEQRVLNAKGIFLSYPSEDVLTASNIFHYFKSQYNFNIWMDTSSLAETDRYNAVIRNAIRDCNIFVPILSPQVKDDIKAGNMERYYFEEWKTAYSYGKVIVPICVGGYDYRDEYHNEVKEMLGFNNPETDITILSVTKIDEIATKIKELL